MEKYIEKSQRILKQIVSCRMIYYILAIILFIITYYMDLKNKLGELNALDNGNYLKYFVIVSAISAIIVLLLIIFSKLLYKKLKIHLVFSIFALIIGGMYVFFMPVGAQSDEPAHIYRCFEVAEGNIISGKIKNKKEITVEKSLVDMINVNSETKKREYKKYYDIQEMIKINLNKGEKVEIDTSACNYHGISYLPQAIGVKIGLLLNLNPYFICLLGRITGLLITIGLLTIGIKKLPSHKLFASIVLLSPVVLSYAAAFSADSMTLASIFLLFSYIMNYKNTKQKIKKVDYIVLAVLTFIVAISKFAYLPVIGILLFIPKECYKNVKVKYLITALYMIMGIGVVLWWFKLCSINPVANNMSNTNSWIYTNPIEYLIVIFRTTIGSLYDLLTNMFAGYFLCHNQVHPYAIVPIVYIIISACSFFQDGGKEKKSIIEKILTIGIIIVTYVLISTSMYIYNTAYKAPTIIGIQGRYLIPLLMLTILFGDKKIFNFDEYKLTNIALIANFTIFLTMFTKFIV